MVLKTRSYNVYFGFPYNEKPSPTVVSILERSCRNSYYHCKHCSPCSSCYRCSTAYWSATDHSAARNLTSMFFVSADHHTATWGDHERCNYATSIAVCLNIQWLHASFCHITKTSARSAFWSTTQVYPTYRRGTGRFPHLLADCLHSVYGNH